MQPDIKQLVTRLSRLISDAEDRAKEFCDVKDLTSSQVNYIETIAELENPNITELSMAMGLRKPSVTVAVERLIKRGCIYKTHSDADRRTAHLHLTDVGRQVNMRHDVAHDYIAGVIVNSLRETERAELVRLLSKVVENV